MKLTLKEIGESLIKLHEQGKEVESIHVEHITDKTPIDHFVVIGSIMENLEKSIIKIVIK